MTDAPQYFFGIGAQKAGTTWLHDVLNSYPDCALPALKELHFFNTRHLEGNNRPVWMYLDRLNLLAQLAGGFQREVLAYYSRLDANGRKARGTERPGKRPAGPLTFKDGYLRNINTDKRLANVENLARYLRIREPADYVCYMEEMRRHKGARVAGEFTPAYSLLPATAFQEMDQLFPGCRFVFIMRDPLDRFLSQLRFRKKLLVLKGQKDYDPAGHFDTAILDQQFLLRSDYRQTVETLESVIPRDRILYLFFEELVSEDSLIANLRQVEAFLGLVPRPAEELMPFSEQKSNASEAASFSADQLARARAALAPIYDFVIERFGRVPAAWAL